MNADRQDRVIIEAVMRRFPDAPYRTRERAADAAMKALAKGKTLTEAVKVADEFVSVERDLGIFI